MSEEKAREILKKEGMSDIEAQEFIDGIRKGVRACKEGRMQLWSEVKKELGIK